MGILGRLRKSKRTDSNDPIGNHFQYQPLPQSGIRLVTFTEHGIDLTTYQWLNAPNFHALSYVCGETPSPPRHYVQCRDVERNRRGILAVAPNLFEALPHLKSLSRTPLWIDAICIDQHTIEEKEKAVARMDDVYKLASTVLIWLGPHADDSELAMFFFSALCDSGALSITSPGKEPIHQPAIEATRQVLAAGYPIDVSPQGFSSIGLPSFGHPLWTAIIKILTRPWTTRVWTFQEAKLARRAMVVCGESIIPWNHFLPIATDMIHTQILYQNVSRIPPNLVAFDLPVFESGKMFLTYLSNCRTRSCYLKEDRVYALLSMADKSLRDEIPVKYSTDANHYQSVYLSVARALVRQGLFYMLLSLAPSHNKPDGLPSWCPDWSLPAKSVSWFPNFEAGLSLVDMRYCEVHPERMHSVMVRGACLDKVEQVIDNYEWYFPDDEVGGTTGPADQLLSWLQNCHSLTQETVTNSAFWEPYWETMLGHVEGKMGLDSNFPSDPEQGLHAFAQRLDECRDHISPEESELTEQEVALQMQVLSWMDRQWPGRVFFSTQGGRVGYADRGVERGDMICIFYGLPRLSVLRPRQRPRYQAGDEMEFLSTAYVHGLNLGEGCSLPAARESKLYEIT